MPKTDVDQLARHLLDWGKMAHDLPPAWDGDGVRQPMYGPHGEYIGHVLPGRGLYLGSDLKNLKITKDLPFVYEYSRYNRILEWMHRMNLDERGAITTYDGILAARAGGKGEDWTVTKASHTTAANTWHSPMGQAGIPGAVTYPATTAPTDAVPDRATAGYFGLIGGNTSGADKKYLLSFGWSSASAINMLLLHDVLVHAGAFRLTVTGAETIASPTTITRQYTTTLGAGALITFIATTAVTASAAATFTVTYTNQAGTASQTIAITIAVTNDTAIANRLYPPPGVNSVNTAFGHHIALASGDYGVRALKQTQVSVAQTGGPITGLIYQPLMYVPGLAADTYVERDTTSQIDGLLELIQVSNVWGAIGVFLNTNGVASGVQRYAFKTCAG